MRPTETAVSRLNANGIGPDGPSVRSQLIARPVGNPGAGLEALSGALSNFFQGAAGAVDTLHQTAFIEKKASIERENSQQQVEGQLAGLNGTALTPEQQKDWDYVTPFNEARAGKAAAEDSVDFQLNVLPNLKAGDDLTGALNGYIAGKLQGADNKLFAVSYADKMLRGNIDALAKHQVNLHSQLQSQLQNDWAAGIESDIKIGAVKNADDLNTRIANGAALFGPGKVDDGRNWAVASVLNAASRNGTLDQVTSLLQQPVKPTPDNPNGSPWSQRYPQAFNDLWKDALKQTDVAFEKKVTDASFGIKEHLAAGNVEEAFAALAAARGTFGDQKEFRADELDIIQAMTKGAGERTALAHLLGTPNSVQDPAEMSKYGGKAWIDVLQNQGPLAAAMLAKSWNTLPSEAKSLLDTNLTRADDPQTIAAFFTGTAHPLWQQAPALLAGALGQDAEFVLRYMEDETTLHNTDPLKAAQQASTALNYVRQNKVNPDDVKLWDDKPGAAAAFQAKLTSKLESALGAKVPPQMVTSTYLPAIQRAWLYYQATGRSDAVDMAMKSVIEGAHSRIALLPNEDGNVYATNDGTPDSATKWKTITLPDGSTFNPADKFREESKRFPWIAGGDDLGVRPGNEANVVDKDGRYVGAMDVFGHDGMPVVFVPGQKIEWDHSFAGVAPGIGATTDKGSIDLPKDETAAVGILTEMFKGTGFRVSKQAYGWQLQYQPQAPVQKDLAQLSADKALQNEIKADDASKPSTGEQLAQTVGDKWRKAMDTMNTASAAMWPNLVHGYHSYLGGFVEVGTRPQDAFKDQARSIISVLQDKGMVPYSTGTTKPLPEFKDAGEIVRYINSEILRGQIGRRGLPVEPADGPVDAKYVTLRYDLLKTNEGIRNKVYDDGAGHPTIGMGFNLDVPANMKAIEEVTGHPGSEYRSGKRELTDTEIQGVFEKIIGTYESAVSDMIKVPLNAYQRSALVSLAYHTGHIEAGVAQAINTGDWNKAIEMIRESGRKQTSFLTRREREASYLARGIG